MGAIKCPNCESTKNARVKFGDREASVEWTPNGTRMHCSIKSTVNVCLSCGTLFISKEDCRKNRDHIERSALDE